MQVDIQKNNKDIYVKVVGPLNTITAAEFLDAVTAQMHTAGVVTIDVSEMEYTSSAGLRALLTIDKMLEKDDGMKILHPNDVVMSVFDESGLSRIFNIER